MPQSINWSPIEALPPSKAPIINNGWILLVLLPPTDSSERLIQPRCTLCSKNWPPVPARTHGRTSNWLEHIRIKHPAEAKQLKHIEQALSTSSISAQSQ